MTRSRSTFMPRGWSGINVEPVTEFFERLQAQCSRDINLQCVLGDSIGTHVLNLIEGSGLSTTRTLDAKFIADLDEIGYSSKGVEVPSTTLARVCSDYIPDGVDIDFLKIDLEGAEAEVLRGANWQKYRPKVVVIEAIRPVVLTPSMSQPKLVDTSSEWESQVLASGYLFALTDGLNRFYVREETKNQVALELQKRVQQGDDLLAALRTSTSWKVTAPMRAFSDWLRRQKA